MNTGKKMGTLFIIGNGFDCYWGLKTTVSDFMFFLSKKRTYDGNNVLEDFEACGVDWGEYEESISSIELMEIENRIIYPNYSSDHESDRDGGILEMEMYTESMRNGVFSSIGEMVEKANLDLCSLPLQVPFFDSGDAIISFNYTSTVERLYFDRIKIPILHIHGFFEAKDKLVFGYGQENPKYENWFKSIPDEDRDFYVDEQQRRILEFYKSFRKELQLKKLQEYICSMFFEKVVVLGHSMSSVDSRYMELVEKVVHPSVWEVSIFDNSPSDQQLALYSFSSKIQKIKIEKYLMKDSGGIDS